MTTSAVDFEDSNIALLGSDLERRVREHAGDTEPEWQNAGKSPGIQVWRIEQFRIKPWPDDKKGTFYDGDSYIVLHTYAVKPDSEDLAYDLHFWLGQNTSTDEAGTSAYKTVELDDHLHGAPIQYRELQGNESSLFLSYFPTFHCLSGGAATGFHHVTEPPEPNPRLFAIKAHSGHSSHSLIYQLPLQASSLKFASVFVLDKGSDVWQYSKKGSPGKTRFQAAEFARTLADAHKGQGHVQVYDEGGQGAGAFLSELGVDLLNPSSEEEKEVQGANSLWKVTKQGFEKVSEKPARSDLESSSVFLVDLLDRDVSPTLFVWVGRQAAPDVRRKSIQVGQDYLNQQRGGHRRVCVVRVDEGRENRAFLDALGM